MRDLYITTDWTERFTNLVDEHIKLPKKGRLLYVNTGTGDHALALRDKLKRDVEMVGVAENKDLLNISKAKAEAVRSEVVFQTSDKFPQKSFDKVLADAMFVQPKDLPEFIDKTVAAAIPSGEVLFLLPTAGSYSEIFSYLWEVFFSLDLLEHGAQVERLIIEIPTVTKAEELAASAGLEEIETQTKTEVFEYDTGTEFVESSLVQDYLLPVWLDFLSAKEKRQAAKKLAQIVDADRDGLTFRFSVKATFLSGKKTA